jgi:hypothetical protein
MIHDNPTNTNHKWGIPEGMVVNMMRINACGSTLVCRLTRLPIPKGIKWHGHQNATRVTILGHPCEEGSITE